MRFRQKRFLFCLNGVFLTFRSTDMVPFGVLGGVDASGTSISGFDVVCRRLRDVREGKRPLPVNVVRAEQETDGVDDEN